MLYFPSYGYYKGLKQQQWPSASLKVIANHAIRYTRHWTKRGSD